MNKWLIWWRRFCRWQAERLTAKAHRLVLHEDWPEHRAAKAAAIRWEKRSRG